MTCLLNNIQIKFFLNKKVPYELLLVFMMIYVGGTPHSPHTHITLRLSTNAAPRKIRRKKGVFDTRPYMNRTTSTSRYGFPKRITTPKNIVSIHELPLHCHLTAIHIWTYDYKTTHVYNKHLKALPRMCVPVLQLACSLWLSMCWLLGHTPHW